MATIIKSIIETRRHGWAARAGVLDSTLASSSFRSKQRFWCPSSPGSEQAKGRQTAYAFALLAPAHGTNSDQKATQEIDDEIHALVQKAEGNRLSPGDPAVRIIHGSIPPAGPLYSEHIRQLR